MFYWRKNRETRNAPVTLPWYADSWLLKKLGARFRTRDRIEETLIDSVVYSRGADEPILPRTIGRRYLGEFLNDKDHMALEQDSYTPEQLQLFMFLGICLSRCHELEFLISHSFILGGISKRHQQRRDTVQQVVQTWRKMTFGQMLRAIGETWEIDPVIHAGLKVFAEMRNLLAHGLTMDDQYNINDPWGCDELVRFMALFESGSRIMREVFAGSFYASMEIGGKLSDVPEGERPYRLTRKMRRQIGVFFRALKPRESTVHRGTA